MTGIIRKPVRVEDEETEEGDKREAPTQEREIQKKHFPSPGRDAPVPPLPDGQAA